MISQETCPRGFTRAYCGNGDMDPMSQPSFRWRSSINWDCPLYGRACGLASPTPRPKGKHIGRKPTTKDDIPTVFYKHFPAFQDGHMNASEFARICGLSRTTVYKYLKLLE